MSLFRDDFYSTKVTRRDRHSWNAPRRSKRSGLPAIVLSSVMAGILLTLGVVYGLDKPASQAAGPAPAPSAPAASTPPASTPPAEYRGDWNQRVVDAGDRVRPSVVSVLSVTKEGNTVKGIGMGSGVIFRKSGDKICIVTNNHVVESGTSYEIVFSDNVRRKAELIGRDSYTDLAVLEADGTDIKNVAEFGDSDKLKPGETAIAIGNPLGLGFSQTTTVGVISSPLRTIPMYLGKEGEVEWDMDVIQTDAAINQGNSGGALVNLEGKVIGINSMKIADAGVEGLGFAIPINGAKPIIEQLMKEHRIKRPKMGIYSEDLQDYKSGLDVLKLPEDVKTGIIVTDVSGPAKDAGLKTRDVIVELDGKAVNSTKELRKYLFREKKIGDKLSVTFYRAGKKETVTMTLAELEAEK